MCQSFTRQGSSASVYYCPHGFHEANDDAFLVRFLGITETDTESLVNQYRHETYFVLNSGSSDCA